MPTYEVICKNPNCTNYESPIEVFKPKVMDEVPCPLCGWETIKNPCGGTFHLKGDGWFRRGVE